MNSGIGACKKDLQKKTWAGPGDDAGRSLRSLASAGRLCLGPRTAQLQPLPFDLRRLSRTDSRSGRVLRRGLGVLQGFAVKDARFAEACCHQFSDVIWFD